MFLTSLATKLPCTVAIDSSIIRAYRDAAGKKQLGR